MAQAATDEHGSEEVHVEHIYSPSALLIGIGAFFTYLGIGYFDSSAGVAFTNMLLPLGAVVMLAGFGNWIREDMHFWNVERKDPGVSAGKDVDWWGMIYFLFTEVMLFGGLFAAFFTLRAENPEEWASTQLPVVLTGINSLILLSSGLTIHYAVHAIKHDNRKGLIMGLVGTIILGTIFLGIQVIEYVELIHEGITLGSGHFGSIFYVLTGTHGFHVFLGLVFMVIMLVRTMKGQFTAERHVGVDAFAIYWHFVDVVWIMLYFIVYIEVI